MSIFKTKGFDTLIGKDNVFRGELVLNGVCVVDGFFDGSFIKSDQNADVKSKAGDTLIVNGVVNVNVVECHNLTVCGGVTATDIVVEGTLAVKGNAKITAKTIYYRTLVTEPGVVILGELKHLDHVSEGEKV